MIFQSLAVTNSLLTGGVTLTKVDDVDGATLEGAEFIIVDAHDTKKVVRKGLTTDEHGKVSASIYVQVTINLLK